MFRLQKPTADEIGREVIAASLPGMMSAEYLDECGGVCAVGLPNGFALDRLQSRIGKGKQTFERAIQAFKNWTQFDLGWTRVANSSARIEAGQIVAVEMRSLGLWSLNLSQIVEVIQMESRFGFIYKTTQAHVEEGEERFEVMLDEKSGAVSYETEAVSRPRDLMALLGYPVTRAFQHRFGRDSHKRMLAAVGGWD
ncbi:MAG: DUF1990 domain-containing protein [Terracidiphilus sp.]